MNEPSTPGPEPQDPKKRRNNERGPESKKSVGPAASKSPSPGSQVTNGAAKSVGNAAKSVGKSKESGGPREHCRLRENGGPMASDSPVRSSDAPRRIDDAVADAIGSVDNAPSLGMHHAGMSIDGYSRAAVQTYWRIAELKIGFDLGAQPWDFMALPRYFITHSHLDHIAALPAYVARRRMMKMEQPTIYLPDHTVATVDQLLKVFSRLDRGRLPCKLVPITPHQEIEISRELVVTTYPMRHSIPALGFIVWERRKKLKPEFSHLTGDQIRDIKLSGTEVTHEIRIPLIAYTGDTAPPGLDDHPDMYRAKILITEMTFVAPEHRKDKIHKHGHMHLDDFVQRRNDFKNELIICGHFSVRYNEQQIRRWIDRALPDRLDGRLKVWL
ncbi:MAG: MBL fold metallo-hydrolase [Pirellula sp.]